VYDHDDHNILITKLMEFGLPDAIIQWMRSFLRDRRQCVKIGDVVSDWLAMDAGMPQGSYLGPLTFITLVDSLLALCMTHKYVNDTMLSEIVAKSATSHMQIYCDEVVQQSEQARMNINGCKTKEMLIGSISKDPPPHLMLCGATVDRVTTFKLLGFMCPVILSRQITLMLWSQMLHHVFIFEAAESSQCSNPRSAALLHSDSPAGS